jgi:hypothetical protein
MCNNCQNSTCYQCNQPKLCVTNDCSCPVKDLSTDCILYTGDDLTCSGIKNKTILTDLIQQLDEFICNLTVYPTVLISVGTGTSIYKGVDLQGRKEIRTIKVSNLGTTGYDLVKPLELDTNGGVLIPSKKIDSDSLLITDSGTTLKIDIPSFSPLRIFYVNTSYTGSQELGTRIKPFKTLKNAILAYIDATNGGTHLSPVNNNLVQIELLSNVTADSTTPLSVNGLNIQGNGFTISMYHTQEYPISTKYLIDLDPKISNGSLSTNINMTFSNVRLHSYNTPKIVYNLNFTSPTFSGSQNLVKITFSSCLIHDATYSGVNSSAYTNTGQTHFGAPVLAQNTLPGDAYMIKIENTSWDTTSGIILSNCELRPTTSTALYCKNSTLGVSDKLIIDFTYRYRNYSTILGGQYLNSTTVNSIVLENTGSGNTFIKISELVSNGHPSGVGGQDSFIKTIGHCGVIISKGDFYIEKFNNLIQMNSDSTSVELTNFDASGVTISDSTYGAFKFNGTPGTQKYVSIQDSKINNVKQGLPSTNYILPSASFAIVNGAMFSLATPYVNNAAALAGGLISNNMYFNTTTNLLTKVT